MIDVYLSSDGKHTVHLNVATVEESEKLLPDALRLYGLIVEQLGTKPALWEAVMNGKQSQNGNGHLSAGTVPADESAPVCEFHQVPMTWQDSAYGRFWSCHRRNPDGSWCSYRPQ